VPSANSFQTNFTAGELSPRLYSRVDVNKYPNGAYKLQNLIVQRFGGARKRGGSQFIYATKDSAKLSRLLPFVYSVTQAYVLEFGDLYIRVFTNGGIVNIAGTPIEVVTPWSQTEIDDLQFAQSADVLYITHPNYAPRKLSRVSATSFTLDIIDFKDGPYLEINGTTTTLTPAATGNLTSIAGTVATSPAAEVAYPETNAYDSDSGTLASWNARAGQVDYTFSAGTYVCDGYLIVANSIGSTAPIAWTLEGYNGSSWIVLDSRASQTGWSSGESRSYDFINETAYEAYRFKWRGQNDTSLNYTQFSEIYLHQSVATQTAFNLTASAVTGINDDTGFQTTDVGRHIRLLASDGIWRWVKIIARTSTTVVTVKVYGQALPNTGAITNWKLGAWSDETGWPACINFYNGRLCFARTATQPQTTWMTVVDDLDNFEESDPLQDDDAISANITSESINEIKWLAESTNLFLGTTAAIRTIGPTSESAAFSPTNIRQKRETNYGASSVLPIRVGTTALYTGYYRKDVREIAYSFDVNGFVSNDLSILSEHITARRIKEMAYAQNPASVVWMVMDDGSLAGMTYERDQDVVAFHNHVIGGTSVTVESVTTIPGSGADEVWLIVKRTINGSTKRYVERLSEGLSDTAAITDANFLDSYLRYSGAATSTISGLGHLEGQSVYVYSSVQFGPYTVSGGSISTGGNLFTSACVGLPYTTIIETLSPEAGAAGGTAQTRQGKSFDIWLRLNRSIGGTVGPHDGTADTLDYTGSIDNEGNYGIAGIMYTGDVRVPIEMGWNRQKRLRITQAEASPFHVLGLISEIRVSG